MFLRNEPYTADKPVMNGSLAFEAKHSGKLTFAVTARTDQAVQMLVCAAGFEQRWSEFCRDAYRTNSC